MRGTRQLRCAVLTVAKEDAIVSQLISLHAGTSSSGSSVREELLVESAGERRYRVLRSPGLIQGIAAGDTIELSPPDRFAVVARGGNLCVLVFGPASLDAIEAPLSRRLSPLGGILDGKTDKQLVYTVPVRHGFPVIENILRECVDAFANAEWYFGNVYDPADGTTPLNWWPEPPPEPGTGDLRP